MKRISVNRPFASTAACMVAVVLGCSVGCNRSPEPAPPKTTSSAEPLDPAEVVRTPAPGAPQLVATDAAPDDSTAAPRSTTPSTAAAPPQTTPAPGTEGPAAAESGDNEAESGDNEATSTTPLSLADSMEQGDEPALQLRSDLSPEQLAEFLSAADQDMQLIFLGRAGLTTQAEAVAEMRRIIRAKLEASRRLIDHPASTAAQRSIGKRGELQSLSHLASQGDLQAAQSLEEVARAGLAAEDAKVQSDSRLVLIGFAIESLQNGDDEAAATLVELIEQYAAADAAPDVPAMMVMGQAREVLARYGHHDEAQRVREKILATFGDSPESEVAMMAARLAGDPQLDDIERMRNSAMQGEAVSVEDWVAAATQLLSEARELSSVQYLARTALEFEGSGNEALATATYDVLRESFAEADEADDAASREAAVALKAYQARQAIIGTEFQSELPTLDGEQIAWSDYRGKIVLLPFWTVDFPASLQLLPTLQQLREQHPDQIAILGVNLDTANSQRQGNASEQLGFPSLHSETNPDAAIPNPLANQFGMVSMPFLVILDRDGTVAAICFTEQRLRETVTELLRASQPPAQTTAD